MKKTLFSLLLLAASYSLFGQTDSIMLADYEINSAYPARTNGWNENLGLIIGVDNPIKDAINPSNKAISMHLTDQWGHAIVLEKFDEPISLAKYPNIKLKVLSDSAVSKKVGINVIDINDFAVYSEVTLPADVNTKWAQVTIDLAGKVTSTPVSFIKKIEIMIDRGTGTPAAGNIHNKYFVDDIKFYGPPVTVLETDILPVYNETFSDNGWWGTGGGAPMLNTINYFRSAQWGGSALSAVAKFYTLTDSLSMAMDGWSGKTNAYFYPYSTRPTLGRLTIKDLPVEGLQNLKFTYNMKWVSAPASWTDYPTIEYSVDGTTWNPVTTSSTLPTAVDSWANDVTHNLTGIIAKNIFIRITNNATGIVMVDEIKLTGNPVFATSVAVYGTGNVSEITTDNGTLQMTDTIQPLNASQSVIWSLENGTGMAELSSTGLLTAFKNGTVTVKARAKDIWGTKVGEKVVTLSNQIFYVDSIAIKGDGNVFTIDQSGDTLDIITEVLPDAAHNKTINVRLRTIGDTAALYKNGKLIPVRDGQVYLVGEATDGSGVKDSVLFTMTNQVPLTGIAFDKDVDSIKTTFGNVQLNIACSPLNASNKSVKYFVLPTADGNIASVDDNGKVTAKLNGIVNIRVVSSVNATIADTIKIVIINQPIPLTGITFDKNIDSIKTTFGNVKLNIVCSPLNASDKSVKYYILPTADGEIASIDENGNVFAKLNGIVNVRVVSNENANIADTIKIVIVNQVTWKEFNVATKVDTTNIKNNADFSVKGKIAWDSKFIYLNFDVTDDSIFAVGKENTWMLDNFEVYFDMNNLKSPAFPRGQSTWPSSYDKQAGSWQLRLIPGTLFDSVNKSNKGWCIENYKVTANGYKYELMFQIDSLLKGYVPEAGKIIGFDVLASDNDNAPNYRDQLSYHAKLGSIWCDAASWGTLKFTANGSFDAVYDEIKPSKITNLKAEKSNKQVMLTWDPATDNIVVEKYVVFVNKQEDTTLYAQKTGNACVVKGIDQNIDYTFSVAAIDVEGNLSDTVSVTINTVGMDNYEISKLSIYPNPSASFISLNNKIAVSIEVYNSSGQLVIMKSLNAGEKIDISSLIKGVYSVKIIESNKASVLRLIKK